MISELVSAWAKLGAESRDEGVSRLRFHPEAPVDLFVAIENPGATRLFIAEAPRGSFRPRRWTSCAGFSAQRAPAPTAGRDMLIVRLNDASATDIFTAIVDDILTVATSGKAAEVLDRIAGRLERWQRFLELRGTAGLTVQEQCGLYGELWFAETVLMPAVGPAVAVEAWTGPAAGNQDFQLARACIELKASLASASDVVRISNVRQLDETGIEALFLVHLKFESRQGSGDTLNAIVLRIRGVLGDLVTAFNDRLAGAGYLDVHRDLYATTGYVPKQRRNFRVAGDFPRLRDANLPEGVTDVAYSISLAACMPHATSDEQVTAMLVVS